MRAHYIMKDPDHPGQSYLPLSSSIVLYLFLAFFLVKQKQTVETNSRKTTAGTTMATIVIIEFLLCPTKRRFQTKKIAEIVSLVINAEKIH